MNLCVDDIEKFGRLFKPRRKFVTIAFRTIAEITVAGRGGGFLG
jgi:hypothetical protein